MDLLADPKFKKKYQKNKLTVKRWENDFKEKYGRKPSKDDIRVADDAIKESYKMYYKLKTRALDETLSDITFSDESRSNVSANTSDIALSSPPLSSSVISSENVDPTRQDAAPCRSDETEESSGELPRETQNPPEAARVASIGRDDESLKPARRKSSSSAMVRSTSFQLSRKLFSSSNLTKRNPRKSLSVSGKARNAKSELALTEDAVETSVDGFDPTASIFGETLRVVQGKANIALHPTNAIRQLFEGTRAPTERNIDRGWLERCTRENNTFGPRQRSSGMSDSGVESMDMSDPSFLHDPGIAATASPDTCQLTDSEDFVCNSDSEDERRERKRAREAESEGTIQRPSKRLCLVSTNEPRTPGEQKDQPTNARESAVCRSPVKNEEPQLVRGSGDPEPEERRESSASAQYADIKEQQEKEEEAGDSEEEEEEDQKPKKNKARGKGAKRVTRATTGKLDGSKARERKSLVASRVTRSARKKASVAEEPAENEQDTSEDPSIPIYEVEAARVVPRFAMPVSASGAGDLVDDFTRCVKDNRLAGSEGAAAVARLEPERGASGGLSARERLEKKVASGRINDNFVRINIKKKVFVRGKKHLSGTKYRRDQWKKRKKNMDLPSSERALDLADYAEKSGGACSICGTVGHTATRCPATRSQELLPIPSDLDEEDDSGVLTLEESAKLATTIFDDWSSETATRNPVESSKAYSPPRKLEGHKIPEHLLAKLLPPPRNGPVEPIFPVLPDDNLIETPDQVFQALRMFGHEDFRPGQEKAVMRILSGRSTLVTLSTGSGKSLCYQLPAYLYAKRSKCITLVVSPLVSLMDDQVTGVPKFLSAAALHTGQTASTREQIVRTIEKGELDVLLVSPEAVVASEGSSAGLGSLLSRRLPPIAFACIDEAHCISQWSHNFRPSYLTVCRVLVEKLGVRTILGLTATATRPTAESIVRHLNIPDGISGVISDSPMPDNLILTVSRDEQRDRALVELVLSQRFRDCDSIIVYCTRRDECVRIAGLLRVSLQDGTKPDVVALKGGGKCSPYAEAYHAGLTASRRRIVQRSFMSGRTRIVVATVAFGMGINKSDIRSVIHYNMPASFEGYVQEVGRAGRDNLPAHCHLFLAPSQIADKLELRRHIFANSVDRHTIRRLLRRIFVPCSCPRHENNLERCPGHEVAIPIDETVRALDITEETISTLLCYLELHPKRLVKVLSSVYTRAKVTSYAGPGALRIAAQSSPPLAFAMALNSKKDDAQEKRIVLEFPVVDVASAIGWDSGLVKSHLKNLEWQTTNGMRKRSAISVQYDTLGFRVRAPGDLTDLELDEALEALADRARSQEISALNQLETIHASLNEFSHESVRRCMQLDDTVSSRSESLKMTIREYFNSQAPPASIELTPQDEAINEAEITGDVRNLIMSYRDNSFTGRAVARIFHGIQSPNYSALTWSRCRFWRMHLSADFNAICRIANREILAMR